MKKARESFNNALENKDVRNYLFWGMLFFLLMLSYFVLRSYLVALISAFVLAYLIRPVHVRLSKKMGNSLAAFVSILIVILVLILPAGAVIGGVGQQAHGYLSGGEFDDILQKVFSLPLLEKYDIGSVESIGPLLLSFVKSAFSFVPSFLASLFIMFFGMYYILIDWEKLALNLKKYIPLKDKDRVIKEISRVTNILVYGSLFIALVEFVVAALGFYLLGVKFYLLLSSLIFFFAFIPGLGPTIIWVPLAVYYFFTGNIAVAIGVLIIGLILSMGIDAVLRVKILGGKSRINPLIMIIGILGGLSVFGVFGFIVGPLVLVYTIEILEEALKS